MSYLYKSNYNITSLGGDIIISIFLPLAFLPIIQIKLLLIILILLLFYVILTISISCRIYYFYDTRIEAVYKTRFFKRKKIIHYENIDRIVYKNTMGKGDYPKFRIYLKNKRIYKTFFIRSFAKRKEMIDFLSSKKVNLVINSISKKDELFTKKLNDGSS